MKFKWLLATLMIFALLYSSGCAPSMSNYVPRDRNLVFEPKAESVVVLKLESTKKGTVKSDDFRLAVIEALKHANLFSKVMETGNSEYELTAELVGHQNTAFGMDMTNSTVGHYLLKKSGTQNVVYEETVSSSHTATVSEACVGAQRDIKATEGSVKANIKKFIWNLSKIEF